MIDTIFISHAHRDEAYVRELVNLLTMIKVPNIVCSSYPGYHIPNDEDIYDYLHQKLSGNSWVIYVLSDHYYKSPACLNEMGACWILNKKYTAILTPSFDYKEMKGAINPNQISFKLNDLDRLYEFLENARDVFKIEKQTGTFLVKICEQAVRHVNQLADDERRNRKMAGCRLEGIRLDPEDGRKFQFRLRLSNPEEFDIRVDVIKIEAADENGETFSQTLQPANLKLYSKENKIVFLSAEIGDSNYEPYIHQRETVDLKFSRDVW
ncbi:toll/interleukin-1 receptor domain-containing protein [Metabacillus indicus]|uniref:toll/interleukin-1 receptor domain-containing protein n=1 Tax=Metabacillus indicus TaxID=246786 RepID=UPI002A09D52C|nr:toll/interleukin-1 receptor domain-containing protein [Metabacillus indicus]MDX8291526.1 toll/interleukin-1 receptor domain-containing protein [Metabacillus indicus]